MSPVAPSAYAVAHMRRKPVTRDSIVAVDIIAVERAIEGLLMVPPLGGACRGDWWRAGRDSAGTSVARANWEVGPEETVPFCGYTRRGHYSRTAWMRSRT